MTDRLSDERERARALQEHIDLYSKKWTASGGEWVEWRSQVINLVRRVYGPKSEQEDDFNEASWFEVKGLIKGGKSSAEQLDEEFRNAIPRSRAFLNSLMTDIQARAQSFETSKRRFPMAHRLSQEITEADALVSDIRNVGPSWRFDGEPYSLWEQHFKNLIRRAYPSGEREERLNEFAEKCDYLRTTPVYDPRGPDDTSEISSADFRRNLPRLVTYAEALRDDLVARTSLPTLERDMVEDMPSLRIFIVHDGPTGARSKLEDYIRALGAEPVTAENEPSKGRNC